MHWLFSDERDLEDLKSRELLHRIGCQYHWENPGFRDFDDFLDALVSKKTQANKARTPTGPRIGA